MLIYQGFNPETGDLETFSEHCKQANTTESIAADNFSFLEEDIDTEREKKCSKFK